MLPRAPLVSRLTRLSETVLTALACSAPWAFGSVEAWAELLLVLGLAVLTVLRLAVGWLSRSPRLADLLCLPSIALIGLSLLGFLQSMPVPKACSCELLRRVAGGRHLPRLIPWSGRTTPHRFPRPPRPSRWSPRPRVHAAVQLAAVWVLFQCAVGLNVSYRRLRRFGLAITVNATLLALFSLIQAMTWDGKIFWSRPSPVGNGWYTGGPFICHNHLAAYLNLGLGFALGSLLAAVQTGAFRSGRHREYATSLDRGRFLWFAYAVAVLVVGLIATHSRGGFLAMIASAVVTFLVLRPETVRLRAGLICAFSIVPLFLLALGTDSPFQRVASITDAGESGLNGRTEIWRAALRAWEKNPILGAGLGNFEVAVSQTMDRDFGVVFQHAENEFLEILVEGGVVGLSLFLLAIGSLARHSYRAMDRATTVQDRAMILGGLFAGLALLIQSLADFPMHIPGIGVTAVALAGLLYALGRDTRRADIQENQTLPRPLWSSVLIDLSLCAVCAAIVVHDLRIVRAEAELADTGLALPGSSQPGAADKLSRADLARAETRLKAAVSFRPDWSSGYLQLGLVELQLYRHAAADQLGLDLDQPTADPKATTDEAEAEAEAEDLDRLMTDPLWLLGVVHSAKPDELDEVGGVLAHEPVRKHLLPAARAFLEARRCSPFRAAPHAYLACVDYLIQGGEPARVHLERVQKLARANAEILGLAAVASVRVDALDLAATFWRSVLSVRGTDWRDIADLAGAVLDPERILNDVLPPGGHFEIWFADHLYGRSEDEEIRNRFLRASLERVPGNATLSPAERSWIQGQACARLGERDRARTFMQQALGLDLRQANWRLEYIKWLLDWDLVKEAHTQVRIGLELEPYNPAFQNALRVTLDALATGRKSAAGETPPGAAAVRDSEWSRREYTAPKLSAKTRIFSEQRMRIMAEGPAATASASGSHEFLAEVLALAGVLRRRWRIMAVTTLVCLTLAILYLAQARRYYQASSRVLILQQGGRPLNVGTNDAVQLTGGTDDLLATHGVIVSSPLIVGRALSSIGLENLPTLAGVNDPVKEAINLLKVSRPTGWREFWRSVTRPSLAMRQSRWSRPSPRATKSFSKTPIRRAAAKLSRSFQGHEMTCPESWSNSSRNTCKSARRAWCRSWTGWETLTSPAASTSGIGRSRKPR